MIGTHGVIQKNVLVAVTLNKCHMMWNDDLVNLIQINQCVFIGILPCSTEWTMTDHIMTDPLPQESHSVVFALSCLSFQPERACFHHQCQPLKPRSAVS